MLVSALPLIALAVYLSLDRLAAERHANRTSLMFNARALAASVTSDMDRYLAVVQTLAKSPNLLTGDFAAFWREAKEASALVPDAWVIVAEPGGQLVLNTLRPYGEVLPHQGGRQWSERAFASRRPVVSDLFTGVVAQRSVVSVEVAVFRDEAPLYVLAMRLSPDHLLKLLERQQYPTGWLIGILDRQANFVARIPDHHKRVGTPAAEGWRSEIAHGPEGWGEHLSVEGERVHTAYSSTEFGWIVGLSVPEAMLYASTYRNAHILGIAATVILLVSLALAWMAATRIAKPAEVFAVAAADLREGRLPRMKPTGVTEFDGVAHQFQVAAAQIRKHDEHQRTLLHELSHRVKNTLSVVQALVARTLTDSRGIGEARALLISRLLALGRVHEHLTRTDWEGAELRNLVTDELAPFADRVHICGPDVRLKGSVVQTLALALHELATNASKHGALSTPDGTVALCWSIDGSRFFLRWEERNGPSVRPPSKRGFGTSLLTSAISSNLSVKPTLSFSPEGFVYELDVPQETIVATNASKHT